MRKTLSLALFASCAFASPATAASYLLDLTGTVASGTTASVTGGGQRFDFFSIVLAGAIPSNLVAGDEIQATIQLDQSLLVPLADIRNLVRFGLLNATNQNGTTTDSSGTTQIFDGANLVFSGPSGGLTFDQVINSYQNSSGSSFQFDKVVSNFTVDSIGAASLDVDFAFLDTVTVNAVDPVGAAVPEPTTWAMMIVGFGLTGAAMRRRQRVRFAFA